MTHTLNKSGQDYIRKLTKTTTLCINASLILIFTTFFALIFTNATPLIPGLFYVSIFSFCVFFGIWLPFVKNGKIVYNIVIELNTKKQEGNMIITTSNWFFLKNKNHRILYNDCIVESTYLANNIKAYRVRYNESNALAYVIPEFLTNGDEIYLDLNFRDLIKL